MKNATPTMECPACHGSGEVRLPEHLAQVLSLVRRYPNCTVESVHKHVEDEITLTGVSNRMTDLLKAGFLTRRRKGKFYHYTASSPKAGK